MPNVITFISEKEMNKLVEVFKCHAGLIADSEKSLSQIWV